MHQDQTNASIAWKIEIENSYFANIFTVKASNFGPHENFEPFLARSLASLGEFCAKNEQNRLCKSYVRLQSLFHSFM